MRWNNSDYNEGSLKKRGISSIEIDICSLLAPNDIVPVSESNSIKKEKCEMLQWGEGKEIYNWRIWLFS